MTDKPTILYNEAKLEDGSSVVAVPLNPNSDYDHSSNAPKTWTKNTGVSYTNSEFSGMYKILDTPNPGPDPNGTNHYVLHWETGIVSGSISFRLRRGKQKCKSKINENIVS